jgi:hypothetical protein
MGAATSWPGGPEADGAGHAFALIQRKQLDHRNNTTPREYPMKKSRLQFYLFVVTVIQILTGHC